MQCFESSVMSNRLLTVHPRLNPVRREYWFGVGVVGGVGEVLRSGGYRCDGLICPGACADGCPDVGCTGATRSVSIVNIDVVGNPLAGPGELRPELGRCS